MKMLRLARPEASRLRKSKSDPRGALPVALAAALAAAVAAAAVPLFPSTEPLPAKRATVAPSSSPSIPARAVAGALSPSAETLAGIVARRYRIALAAAREVVAMSFHEGRRNGLDPMLILAVIAVESRFNPIAESEQGAVGLMQIVPRFHAAKLAEFGTPSALPPDANIAIGARILQESIRRGGGEAAGLQLYNGAPDDETKAYANRVQAERRRLVDALPRPRDRA